MDKTLFHALKGYLHRCLDREINGLLPGGGRRLQHQRATRDERRAGLLPEDIEHSEIPLIENLLERLEAEKPEPEPEPTQARVIVQYFDARGGTWKGPVEPIADARERYARELARARGVVTLERCC